MQLVFGTIPRREIELWSSRLLNKVSQLLWTEEGVFSVLTGREGYVSSLTISREVVQTYYQGKQNAGRRFPSE
jgi:hypothetical protein